MARTFVILNPAADAVQDVEALVERIRLSGDAIIFRRAARVTVNSRPGMCFNVDAELIGNEPADFEMLSRMLQFVLAAP